MRAYKIAVAGAGYVGMAMAVLLLLVLQGKALWGKKG